MAYEKLQLAADKNNGEPVEQEAFGKFQVRCGECGSLRVEWVNTLGWSNESGGWGEAGFRCKDCGDQTYMIAG